MISKLFYFLKETFSDAWSIVRSPRKGLKKLYQVSLYRNAVYLIVHYAGLGLTGFFFWMAAARLYPDEDVGLASATVAAMTLLSMLAMVGLDHALIRFIPGAGESTKSIINSSLTIAGVISIILALVFIAGLSFWSPDLRPILHQPMLFIAFVVFVAATTLSTLTHRVFTAKRRSSFAMAVGLVFGLIRFVPLAIVAAYSLTLGIFIAWGIATCVSLAISVFFLLPRVEPGYRLSPVMKKDVVSPMVRFASANFLASVSGTVSGSVLPLIVLNTLGKEQTAYFYVTWSISQVMHTILAAVTINLFAEGSHDQQKLREHVKKSLKLMTLILIPAVALILLVGDRLLLAFGEGYSRDATHLLWLLILSAVPLSINLVYLAVARVRTQMRVIVAVNVFMAIGILGTSPYLLSQMGLTGVGVACIASQGIVALYSVRQILRIYSGA